MSVSYEKENQSYYRIGLHWFLGVSQILNDPEKYQPMNPNARRITDILELSESYANGIWNILKDGGVSGIKTIERDELLLGIELKSQSDMIPFCT